MFYVNEQDHIPAEKVNKVYYKDEEYPIYSYYRDKYEGKDIVLFEDTYSSDVILSFNNAVSVEGEWFSKLSPNLFKDLNSVGVSTDLLIPHLVDFHYTNAKVLASDTYGSDNKNNITYPAHVSPAYGTYIPNLVISYDMNTLAMPYSYTSDYHTDSFHAVKGKYTPKHSIYNIGLDAGRLTFMTNMDKRTNVSLDTRFSRDTENRDAKYSSFIGNFSFNAPYTQGRDYIDGVYAGNFSNAWNSTVPVNKVIHKDSRFYGDFSNAFKNSIFKGVISSVPTNASHMFTGVSDTQDSGDFGVVMLNDILWGKFYIDNMNQMFNFTGDVNGGTYGDGSMKRGLYIRADAARDAYKAFTKPDVHNVYLSFNYLDKASSMFDDSVAGHLTNRELTYTNIQGNIINSDYMFRNRTLYLGQDINVNVYGNMTGMLDGVKFYDAGTLVGKLPSIHCYSSNVNSSYSNINCGISEIILDVDEIVMSHNYRNYLGMEYPVFNAVHFSDNSTINNVKLNNMRVGNLDARYAFKTNHPTGISVCKNIFMSNSYYLNVNNLDSVFSYDAGSTPGLGVTIGEWCTITNTLVNNIRNTQAVFQDDTNLYNLRLFNVKIGNREAGDLPVGANSVLYNQQCAIANIDRDYDAETADPTNYIPYGVEQVGQKQKSLHNIPIVFDTYEPTSTEAITSYGANAKYYVYNKINVDAIRWYGLEVTPTTIVIDTQEEAWKSDIRPKVSKLVGVQPEEI